MPVRNEKYCSYRTPSAIQQSDSNKKANIYMMMNFKKQLRQALGTIMNQREKQIPVN
jgi:hypothetical protein